MHGIVDLGSIQTDAYATDLCTQPRTQNAYISFVPSLLLICINRAQIGTNIAIKCVRRRSRKYTHGKHTTHRQLESVELYLLHLHITRVYAVVVVGAGVSFVNIYGLLNNIRIQFTCGMPFNNFCFLHLLPMGNSILITFFFVRVNEKENLPGQHGDGIQM